MPTNSDISNHSSRHNCCRAARLARHPTPLHPTPLRHPLLPPIAPSEVKSHSFPSYASMSVVHLWLGYFFSYFARS